MLRNSKFDHYNCKVHYISQIGMETKTMEHATYYISRYQQYMKMLLPF